MLPQSLALACAEVTLPCKEYGVYFLLHGDEVVYVGQSNHVPSRIKLHISSEAILFDRALWIAMDKSDLSAYEGAFIRALAPTFCIKAPPDTGRDAEVLAPFGMTPNADAAALMAARLEARRISNRDRRASHKAG